MKRGEGMPAESIDANTFHVIAHRGASAYAPENTMAAFRKAVEMGAREVETDVGFTKDAQLLLLHDGTLDRTTSGHGSPDDYILAELKELDAGSWWTPEVEPSFAWASDYTGEKLITLKELFREFGDALVYHVEIKRPAHGLVSAVIDCTRSYGLVDHVYVATVDDELPLREAHNLEPRIKTSLAIGRRLERLGESTLHAAAGNGVAMVAFAAENIDPSHVRLAHDLGLEARCFGIRTKADMIAAIAAGCDGMSINWPDWLLDYLQTH